MTAIISGFGGQPALGSVAFKVGDGLDVGDGWHGDLMQGNDQKYRSKFGRCLSVTASDVDVAFAPGCNGSTDLAHQPKFHAD